MSKGGLRVRELFARKREVLALELVAGEAGLDRAIPSADISSPGLALAGYTERFPAGRIQVMGETEVSYLASLDPAERRCRLERFLSFDVPCVFVTKSQEVSQELVELADAGEVPLLRSAHKTGEFYRRIKPFLEEAFAPSAAMHGSLADVYGVGLLFVGKSGIGKSECVLDLVERGHRLVADDMVLVSRRGNDVLIGRGHDMQRHHMEIRGIGIIDVRALFGVRAIRQQKRIEVVVQLEEWSETGDYDRTGLESGTTCVLDVMLPKVVVPLNPGKNITVISEVVAMRHLLRYAGVDSAKLFQADLLQRTSAADRRAADGRAAPLPADEDRLRPVREYLEEDNE